MLSRIRSRLRYRANSVYSEAQEENDLTEKHQPGDVHAPVEDVEVPFSLKVLVMFMFLALIGLIIGLILDADRLNLMMAP